VSGAKVPMSLSQLQPCRRSRPNLKRNDVPQCKSTSRDARSCTLDKLERAEYTDAIYRGVLQGQADSISKWVVQDGPGLWANPGHSGRRFGITLERAGSISPASLPEKPNLSVNRAASTVYLLKWSGREEWRLRFPTDLRDSSRDRSEGGRGVVVGLPGFSRSISMSRRILAAPRSAGRNRFARSRTLGFALTCLHYPQRTLQMHCAPAFAGRS
jgi:hypothetical protein